MVEGAEAGGDCREGENRGRIYAHDENQRAGCSTAITDDETPFSIDAVGEFSHWNRRECTGDAHDGYAQPDESDSEFGENQQKVEIEENLPSSMDDIHSEDMEQIHSGVPAELPDPPDVTDVFLHRNTSGWDLIECALDLSDDS